MQARHPRRRGGDSFLLEDYTTCLAEDRHGQIWIGHRQQPLEVVDAKKTIRRALDLDARAENGRRASEVATHDNYIRAILPTRQRVYVGYYGDGLRVFEYIDQAETSKINRPRSEVARVGTGLPSPATARSAPANAIKALIERLDKSGSAKPTMRVMPLVDDWRTRGDWLGRYGREWAALAAMTSPSTYFWGMNGAAFVCGATIGPNRLPGIPTDFKEEVLRAWIHWMYTDNPNSLEMPAAMLHYKVMNHMTDGSRRRRQSEWDDHGEAYPMSFDGPDIVCRLRIPQGTHLLSLYDFNKDGHQGSNRYRDYVVQIYDGVDRSEKVSVKTDTVSLCTKRIRDFDCGVYCRYLVVGPVALSIVVKRNYSFNTLLGGVFVDTIDEFPMAYAAIASGKQNAIDFGRPMTDAETLDWKMRELAKGNPALWARARDSVYATIYRSICNAPDAPNMAILSTCAFHLHCFDRWENLRERLGKPTARAIEKTLVGNGDTDGSGTEARISGTMQNLTVSNGIGN